MLALLAILALAQQPASLADALAAAHPGDTIRLPAGTYHGPVVVDRPLVLLGGPGVIIDGGHQGTVITIRADSVSLAGFTVRASGRSMDHDEAAIKLDHCHGCRVERVTIEDPLHGIYLLASHDVDLTDNRITGAADLVESARGNGIHLWNSTGNRITGNQVRGTRDGIYFSFAGHNLVARNDVRGVRYGLHYMYSDDNQFEANTFEHNAAGAAIMFSKRIVFRDNTFSRHVGYRAYGILLQTASEVTAEGNRIEGNLTGLFLDGSTGNRFRNNLIRGNGVGIDLLASTEGNIFGGNVISDNRIAVRKVLGTSENAWSDSGRGNFWNDRQVFDLDGDGLGDRPYQAGDPFAGLAASRPVLDIFSGTLAARALAWADEAFPVFDLPRVTDPHPLAQAPAWLHPAEGPALAAAPVSSTHPVSWWPWLPALSLAIVMVYRARRRLERAA